MPIEYEIYKRYVYSAITELFRLEYLKQEWDWNVKDGKYTVRISDESKNKTMTWIMIFNRRKNVIELFNDLIEKHMEFAIVIEEGFENYQKFVEYLINCINNSLR